MADQTVIPDYNLDDVLEISTPEQIKAIGDPTRQKILGLIAQRAATTKQLAEALGLPKGTVGHHLKSLESAGLIHVVRTRQVRAITEKYYGRVARLLRISADDCAPGTGLVPVPQELNAMLLRQAMSELAPSDDDDDPTTFTISHARIPASEAREFARRLEDLSREFGARTTPGEKVYGLIAGVYLTTWPALPEDASDR
jgi:DNA-binding transcriptional ArsR family regulator